MKEDEIKPVYSEPVKNIISSVIQDELISEIAKYNKILKVRTDKTGILENALRVYLNQRKRFLKNGIGIKTPLRYKKTPLIDDVNQLIKERREL